jgi:heat shock protein HslJ
LIELPSLFKVIKKIKMKMKISLLILFSCIIMGAGCSKDQVALSPEEQELAQAQKITNLRVNFDKLSGTWTLTNYLKEKMPTTGQATIMFAVETKTRLRVNGRSFINNYVGAFEYNEATTSIKVSTGGGFASTKMAGPAELMQAENVFLKNLLKADKFTIDNDILKIYSGNPADEVMYFKRK